MDESTGVYGGHAAWDADGVVGRELHLHAGREGEAQDGAALRTTSLHDHGRERAVATAGDYGEHHGRRGRAYQGIRPPSRASTKTI